MDDPQSQGQKQGGALIGTRLGAESVVIITNGVLAGVQAVYLSTVSIAATTIAAGSAVLVVALALVLRR